MLNVIVPSDCKLSSKLKKSPSEQFLCIIFVKSSLSKTNFLYCIQFYRHFWRRNRCYFQKLQKRTIFNSYRSKKICWGSMYDISSPCYYCPCVWSCFLRKNLTRSFSARKHSDNFSYARLLQILDPSTDTGNIILYIYRF